MRYSFLIKCGLLFMILFAILAVILIASGPRADRQAATGTKTFFEQFVVTGGPIVWLILLPMSLATVYLVVEYSLTLRRTKLLPNGIARAIIIAAQKSNPRQLVEKLRQRDDFVSIAVARAVSCPGNDKLRTRNVIFESLEEQALRAMRKIEWLSLIGNISPMVGLFGTVFGMIKLFNAIVIAGGQPRPSQLADGISVALVTTFWGLFIAIPAIAIYAIFRNRIENVVSDAIAQAEIVLPQLTTLLTAADVNKQKNISKVKVPIEEIKPKRPAAVEKSAAL